MAEEEKNPRAYGESLEQVILGLAARFERLPTDKEVYRFVWGTDHDRQWIWTNKGLPENQR